MFILNVTSGVYCVFGLLVFVIIFFFLNTSCLIHSFVNIFVFIIVVVIIIVYSLATNMIFQTKLNSNTTFIGYYNTIGASTVREIKTCIRFCKFLAVFSYWWWWWLRIKKKSVIARFVIWSKCMIWGKILQILQFHLFVFCWSCQTSESLSTFRLNWLNSQCIVFTFISLYSSKTMLFSSLLFTFQY